MVECKVFRGVGAVIARVTSHTKFSVFAIINGKDSVDFSATDRLFDVDLEATPKRVGAPRHDDAPPIAFADVRFDDRGVDVHGVELSELRNPALLTLGITTLGGVVPAVLPGEPLGGNRPDLTRGGFVGAIYVERQLFETIEGKAIAVAGNPHPWPGTFFELYEITSIAYSSNKELNGTRAGMRYHGFRARVIQVADDRKTIKLDFPRLDNPRPLGPSWFRLDDPSECDSAPPQEALAGVTPITADSQVGTVGPLFVALPRAVGLALSGPKLPIGNLS